MRDQLKTYIEGISNSAPEDLYQLEKKLTEKIFPVKEIGPSSRMMTYFDDHGFLLSERGEERGWRKYCFVEFIWIKMIQELRDMNLPLDIITKIKYYLNDISRPELIAEGVRSEMSCYRVYDTFCQIIAWCIEEKTPTAIKIYKDGSCCIVRGKKMFYSGVMPDYFLMDDYETYVSISISNLIKDCIKTMKLDNVTKFQLIDENELEVLRAMRDNQIKELEIKLTEKDNKKKVVITTKKNGHLSSEQVEQVSKILNMKNYDTITLKKRNNLTIFFEQKKKNIKQL